MEDSAESGLFEKDGVRVAVEGCVRITSPRGPPSSPPNNSSIAY